MHEIQLWMPSQTCLASVLPALLQDSLHVMSRTCSLLSIKIVNTHSDFQLQASH